MENQIIALFKVHLTKCVEILPEFFTHISRYQFSTFVSGLSEFIAFFFTGHNVEIKLHAMLKFKQMKQFREVRVMFQRMTD